MITCQTCGHVYRNTDLDYLQSAYHYSSTTTYSKGDYATPAAIEAAAEQMLTCPRDATKPAEDSRGNTVHPSATTPSGGSMYEGDDRYTAGDEPDDTEPDEAADVTHQP